MLEQYRWQEYGVDEVYRFVDAPPDVVDAALDRLVPRVRTTRPNHQPPAGWLLQQARLHQGLLGGITDGRSALRVDAVCVPATELRHVLMLLKEEWPALEDWPSAFDLALVEGWPSWDAEKSSWEGSGADALEHELPDLPVFGLWWD